MISKHASPWWKILQSLPRELPCLLFLLLNLFLLLPTIWFLWRWSTTIFFLGINNFSLLQVAMIQLLEHNLFLWFLDLTIEATRKVNTDFLNWEQWNQLVVFFFFLLLSFMFENALTHTIGLRLHIRSRRNWRCILLFKPKQRSINSKFSNRILRRVYCLSMNTFIEEQESCWTFSFYCCFILTLDHVHVVCEGLTSEYDISIT